MQDAASASRAPSAERRSILATQGRGKGKNGTKGQHDAKGQGKRGSGRTNKSRPVDAILPFDVDTKSSLSRLHGDAENDYIVENYWIRVDDTTQLLDSKMRARDVTMAELRKQISALELRLWNTATEEDRSKAKAGEQPAGKARNYAAIMDYSRLSGLAKLDLVLALAQWDN
ncbi:unnamed protein product [Amoebophrya sp. A120]|nr:unnamed protein product [Amoebophrya sp. A120]|eukprot:GSA120T00009671001.1